MIRFFDAFQDFDPLTEHPGEVLIWKTGLIIQQAKTMLPKDASIQDLNAALEILNGLRRYEAAAIIEEHSRIDEYDFHHSHITKYFLCTKYVEVDTRPNGEPYPWSSVFSALALACVADYIANANYVEPATNSKNDEAENLLEKLERVFPLNDPDELLINAFEALGYSRVFSEQERAMIGNKKRGEKISKAKLGSYFELKKAVIDAYNSLPPEQRKNVRKSAPDIKKKLPKKILYSFKTEDVEKGIESIISQHKNGKLPGGDKLPKLKSD